MPTYCLSPPPRVVRLERRTTKSLDSSDYSTMNCSASYKASSLSKNHNCSLYNIRSMSADSNHVMNRLYFENIDVLSTPLSSLRSCSEYNKEQSLKIATDDGESKPKSKRSIFSFQFQWKKQSGDAAVTEKCQLGRIEHTHTISSSSDKRKESHEGSMSTTLQAAAKSRRSRSSSSSSSPRKNSTRTLSTSICGDCSGGTNQLISSSRNDSLSYSFSASASVWKQSTRKVGSQQRQTRRSSSNTFFRESSAAFEYILGFGQQRDGPMEIELQTIREPRLIDIFVRDNHFGYQSQRQIPIVPSSSQRDSSSAPPRPSQMSVGATATPREHPVLALLQFGQLCPPLTAPFRQFYASYIRSSSEDAFYEYMRLQPFSSGSYLRAILTAGLCGSVISTYNMVLWPTVGALSHSSLCFQRLLFVIIIAQVVLHVVMVPSRLKLNYLCWESTRVIEAEVAIQYLRTMMHSDSWITNRSIGVVLDVLSAVMLVLCEAYLWSSEIVDPLRPQIVSLCATNMLTIIIRVLVVVVFSSSMHDPDVLRDARRRGLCQYDIEVLPTFVYSCGDDVNNDDCSICLGPFDRGEMLTCLPCDKKHSFHSSCIRQWLQRQNSCPLCQRLV